MFHLPPLVFLFLPVFSGGGQHHRKGKQFSRLHSAQSDVAVQITFIGSLRKNVKKNNVNAL